MNISELTKIDTKSMFKTYDMWPEIAEKSFLEEVKKIESNDIDHIVFCGMGCSGSIGDIITAILSTSFMILGFGSIGIGILLSTLNYRFRENIKLMKNILRNINRP